MGIRLELFSGPGVGINFDVKPYGQIGFGLGKDMYQMNLQILGSKNMKIQGMDYFHGIGSYIYLFFILHLNYTIARLNLSK